MPSGAVPETAIRGSQRFGEVSKKSEIPGIWDIILRKAVNSERS